MTIVASVKVRDGLVLGTDSMTSILDGEGFFLKSYSNARKLFQIGDLPIAAMTYGAGNMGQRSIENLFNEFSSVVLKRKTTVESVAKALYVFFKSAYVTAFGPNATTVFGLFIAGYSRGSSFPEEWEFELPQSQAPQRVRKPTEFGSSWRGVPIPFIRLYMGFDPRILEELSKRGVERELLLECVTPFQSPIVYDGMPLQDAVNFARFILNTTIGISSFELGVPSCGGPLQVAAITSNNGFEWIDPPRVR